MDLTKVTMLKELNFTSTPVYQKLKEEIFSNRLPLYRETKQGPAYENNDQFAHATWFKHNLIDRPYTPGPNCVPFPTMTSQYAGAAINVFEHICALNNIGSHIILRACINVLVPGGTLPTHPHIDHPYEHKNVLVYLNDVDGDTVVGDERSTPREDKVILFEGEHYAELPSSELRTIIVFTFLELNDYP